MKMKSNILSFILGCLFIVLTAAGTIKSELLTVKPATPKSVIIKHFDSPNLTVNYIREHVKKGWVVKTIAGTSQYGHSWIICLEKYE